MFGVINIYKPKGLTSHDVVSIVRKVLSIKQVGHTGTLDPFAEGVLPICVGKATRLAEYFDDDKEYLATVKFGLATDTYDLEGFAVNTSDKKVTKNEVEEALKAFRGEISQLPPIYSAIKVNGKKLYEYARNGEEVKITPRKVHIFSIRLEDFDPDSQTAQILVKCSKGTYIRSIANDLGQSLGCYGHLIRLIRTQAGKFRIENSTKLPVQVLESDENGHSKKYIIDLNAKFEIEQCIQNPVDVLTLNKFCLNDDEYSRVCHGNAIRVNLKDLKTGDFLILVYNNNVVAIGQYDKLEVKVKKVLV